MFLVVILKLRTKEAFRPEKLKDNLENSLIAIGCGAILFILLAGADLAAQFESFSYYFIENAIELTGGKNIVNVIVVDFRGYDTFGEIAVLAIAALTVYNLIKSRTSGSKETEREKTSAEEEI
jgi:multicomponent Na+:H+ antiporter subunit A